MVSPRTRFRGTDIKSIEASLKANMVAPQICLPVGFALIAIKPKTSVNHGVDPNPSFHRRPGAGLHGPRLFRVSEQPPCCRPTARRSQGPGPGSAPRGQRQPGPQRSCGCSCYPCRHSCCRSWREWLDSHSPVGIPSRVDCLFLCWITCSLSSKRNIVATVNLDCRL